MLHLKPTKFTHFLFTLVLSSILFSANTAFAGVEEGKKLFTEKCARCHNSQMEKKGTGPALMDVQSRWADSTNLYKWIKNSQGYLNSTDDPYVKKLFAEYGTVMPGFTELTDANIADILAHIAAYEPMVASAPGPDGVGSGEKDNTTVYWILIVTLLFIAIIIGRGVKHLNIMVRQKYGDPEPDPTPVWKRKNYRPLMVLIGVALLGFLSVAMWNSAGDLGRQQGYAPEQPIAFSHKVHAGINKIDCRYCHVGAERGKAAVIPSLSVCMNCHYSIQEVTGTDPDYPKAIYDKEIAKIYSYMGFNKESLKYESEPEPIQWVKVHNLPDHVYFNHSQHVVVAGLECQTCHGLIEEMDVVEQQGNLSMGWCVNCHRNTEVNFTTNDFYKPYEVLHEKLKNGEIDAIHAEDIGATECQKCHY